MADVLFNTSELRTGLPSDLSGPGIGPMLNRLLGELQRRKESPSIANFEFFIAAAKSLPRIRGHAHAEKRIACMYETGSFLFHNERACDVIVVISHLKQLASAIGRKDWVQKAEQMLGAAYADVGDIAEGITHSALAIDLARQQGSVVAEAGSLVNIGVALNYGGLYAEAIPCFMRVLSISRQNSSVCALRLPALTNLAQSYLGLEEYNAGFEAISTCLAESTEPKTLTETTSRTIREFTFVRLAVEIGDSLSAHEHSLKCQEFARSNGTLRASVLGAIAQALCDTHWGNATEALKRLEDVLSAADAQSALKTDALSALIKAYEAAGEHKKALACLRQLYDTVRAHRTRTVEQMVTLPQSLGSRPFASEGRDLRAFRGKEAELRAQVAGEEAIQTRLELLERLAITADLRVDPSGEHGFRVGKLSGLLAKNLGLEDDFCGAVEFAARLHDIGKIGIPEHVLLRTVQLKEAERQMLSCHPEIGAELLAGTHIHQLQLAEQISRFHHEWWNGEGYPSRLSGKRIPLSARIVAIADVFDALTHGRPYAAAWTIDQALSEIRSKRGVQFDPDLVDLFIPIVANLCKSTGNLDRLLGTAAKSSFSKTRQRVKELLAADSAQSLENKKAPAP